MTDATLGCAKHAGVAESADAQVSKPRACGPVWPDDVGGHRVGVGGAQRSGKSLAAPMWPARLDLALGAAILALALAAFVASLWGRA